jgi:O-antigen/teichoic acid export membrane protein
MMFLRDLQRSSLLAELQIRRALYMSVWTNALAFALIIGAAWTSYVTAAVALLALGLGAAAAFVCYAIPCFARISIDEFRFHTRENWRFGRHTLVANGLSIAILQTVPWLVLATGDKAAVAELAAALGITGLIRPVTQGFASYLTPVLARNYVEGGRERAIRTTMTAMGLMAVSGGVFIGVIGLFGAQLVLALYGVSVSAMWILVPVASSAALEAVGVVLRANARAVRRPSEETVAAGVAAGFGTVAAAVLIPWSHAIGGALALAVNQLAFVLMCLIRLRSGSGE